MTQPISLAFEPEDPAFIRSAQAEAVFNREIRRMEERFLTGLSEPVPMPLSGYPPVPDPLPGTQEQVTCGGWSYHCYLHGIYVAWPNDDTSRDSVLKPWMAVFDRAIRQMLPDLDAKAGPLIAGAIFCHGRIGTAAALLYFPDAITVPMWFSADPDDVEFVPIVSLTAPNPLTAFLVAMTRAHAMNGRMTEAEYWALAGESPHPEEAVTRLHTPGRVTRIGALRTEVGGQVGARLFLDSGWVPEPDHPTFSVEPAMTESVSRWPLALKRERLMGP